MASGRPGFGGDGLRLFLSSSAASRVAAFARAVTPSAWHRGLSVHGQASQATVKQYRSLNLFKNSQVRIVSSRDHGSSQTTVNQSPVTHHAHLGRDFLARLPTVSSWQRIRPAEVASLMIRETMEHGILTA
jgi:hypothetical protein